MSLVGSKRVLFPILVMIFSFSKLSAQNEQNEDFFQDSVWQDNGGFNQEEDESEVTIKSPILSGDINKIVILFFIILIKNFLLK